MEAATAVDTIFFYGSLRDRTLLDVVLGRAVDPGRIVPARAPGFVPRRVAGEAYPVLSPEPGRVAEGVVVSGLSPADYERLQFYEEAEYRLTPIAVETATGPIETVYFGGTAKPVTLDAEWRFEVWRHAHQPVAVEIAREYMHHYGRTPVEEIDTVWPGIKIRGQQRARALAEEPRLGTIRTGFRPGDVEVLGMERAYTSFLAVQEWRLRHRRFFGDWTHEVRRSVVAWGDAVTLLPYDPARDRVLVIEQFRPAPLARGDRNPWCIEVIAGRIDSDETAEATARREAREEAGLEIGRTAEIGGYYPTPGLACEHLTAYVGEAVLDRPGGLHGLAGEGEDIRTMVLDFDAAMAAVAEGAVNTGPALVSLLWLAANRDRLRREWQPDKG